MHSISKKVLLALILSTFLVLSLVYLASYMIQYNNEQDDWQRTEATLTNQIKVILKEPVFSYDKPLITDLISAFVTDKNINSIRVFDQRKKLLAESSAEQIKDSVPMITVPIKWNDDSDIGYVELTLSTTAMNQRLSTAVIKNIIGLVVSIALLSIVLLAVLKKIVVRPIEQVSNVLEDIAQGGGDLTQRIPYKSSDEIGALADSFNNFIGTIQNIVSELADATTELSAVSERVLGATQLTYQGTSSQHEQTNDALEHITQLREANSEIAANAELTAANTRNAHELSSQSQKQMEANMQQVAKLVEELDNTATVVTELRSASNNIGSVLDVIKGIAEQTNLLALNAAIEAARAGESGRGFAVVADEVRALASKTHQSTTEIENIIVSLQSQAQASFDATHRSKELVNVTTQSTKTTHDALNEIVQQMDAINDMNNHIASASEEQSQVTDVVTTGMRAISDGATSLATQAGELEHATAEMTRVEERLMEQLKRFTY